MGKIATISSIIGGIVAVLITVMKGKLTITRGNQKDPVTSIGIRAVYYGLTINDGIISKHIDIC